MTELTEQQAAIKDAQHKGWMIGYTEAWNNAKNGDLPARPPLDDAGNPWKPAIEEPTEFGSVVRAFICGHVDELWVRTLAPEYSGWTNVVGKTVPWQRLCEVEVLRVGIGETYPHPVGDAVVLGPETIKSSDGAVISHKGENYYPTSVVITSSEGPTRVRRFCSLRQDCRMADGHDGGCER